MKVKIATLATLLIILASMVSIFQATPLSAQASITVDGVIGVGEWDGEAGILIDDGMGFVMLSSTTDYLYVLFYIVDNTDARLGQNIKGNDQTSINVNPTDGGAWGFPYDLIFETSADFPWNPKVNSGILDNWNTKWFPNNAQENLPNDLESVTIYSGGMRTTEWKIPLDTIGVSAGDTLKIGGAIEVGDGSSYVYPIGLDWGDVSTFVAYSVAVQELIDQLRDKINSLESEISALEAELSGYKSQLADADKDVEELQRLKSANELEIARLQSEIRSLKREIDRLELLQPTIVTKVIYEDSEVPEVVFVSAIGALGIAGLLCVRAFKKPKHKKKG